MKKKKVPKTISAKEFDQLFDEGKDITPYLDLKNAKMHYPVIRINVDMPKNMVDKLDLEATRIGVPRTSLLKMWVAERVDKL